MEGRSPVNSDWQRDFALIALPALAVFALCLADAAIFSDGDTNWHVATGQWILAHHAVPTTDPFSYTAFGRRWVTQEWLSEVLMALAYAAAGWSGVMLLIAAAAGAAFGLLAAELRRWLGTLSVIAGLGLGFTLLLPHFMARPHMITLPLLVFWTVQLLEARRRDRAPPLWLLPLMLLWANLHGDFVFGLAFTGVFALEAVLAARGRGVAMLAAMAAAAAAQGGAPPPRGLRASITREVIAALAGRVPAVVVGWGVFGLLAGAMTLITPNGLTGLIYPFAVMSMKNLQSIAEWRAVSFGTVNSLEIALFFTLFVCLYRGVRMAAVRLGLLLLLLFMTFQHIRQEVILAMVAPLLMAEPMARALEPAQPATGRAAAWPPLRQLAAPAAVVLVLFVALAVWRVATPMVRSDSRPLPMTALAHVPADLRAKPVFNDYSFGGWLVFEGVRPFIDGRSDMYGDDLLKTYLNVEAGNQAAIDKAFKQYGVQWTILSPTSPLVARLDLTPGWRRLYTDRWAVVQVRADAPHQ